MTVLPRAAALLLFSMVVTCFAQAGDHVIVTGGPALRQWENLRIKDERHDNWWANFVRASTVRIDQWRRAPQGKARIVWMVFRPGYEARGREDGKPYTKWIEEQAAKRSVQLFWFSNADQLIDLLNSRPRQSIRSFDYFGHSNMYTFMFDYGSDIIASSTSWLHQNDLGRISPSVFHPQSLCTSWGCHTGESMSLIWEQRLGIKLRGVKGPTNYTPVGQGQLPMARGPWSR
ncbi:MAG TPA: hypothetical protein VFY13_03285 [Luteolibacter sp.]|nr:hypothetical protein [Luteolibacter sp.]